MLILGDSRLAIKILPMGIVLQLLSELLLCLQELTHHLSLGDHELLLDSHVGRRWQSVTPTCAKTIGGCTGWSHHPKFMRFSLATYSQACLHHPQEEYARWKLIRPFPWKPDNTTELMKNSQLSAPFGKNSHFWLASAKFSKLQIWYSTQGEILITTTLIDSLKAAT
jgi:hypothetical protein